MRADRKLSAIENASGAAWNAPETSPSLPEVYRTVRVPRGGPIWGRLLAFVGPGCLIAVGYMDPGNWATDISGGAVYGYALLSVVMISNFLAIFLQSLAIKLGVATGRDLAQACRDSYNRPLAILLWISAEIGIIACDIAEVIGAAIALQLLFHLPLPYGVALTSLDVLIVLALQGRGFRRVEALVGGLIAVMMVIFTVEVIFAHPSWSGVARGLIPTPRIILDPNMLYIALGILGATVMPHNLYLHSSIVQTRDIGKSEQAKRGAIRYAQADSFVALMLAFMVNAAILILSAAVFYKTRHFEVGSIQDAYKLLTPIMGVGLATPLFAIALLASGQNSTLTGTLAGQIVLEGFTAFKMAPWLRRMTSRLLAIVPALIATVYFGGSGTDKLLIFSQVVLSIQLSFAVIPLVQFTSDGKKMGPFVNTPFVRRTGWVLAIIILLLNTYLVIKTL